MVTNIEQHQQQQKGYGDARTPTPQELSRPLLGRDDIDTALVHRLIVAPPLDYPQQPLHYLLGVYARATAEVRAASAPGARLEPAAAEALTAAASVARELAVSYAARVLTGAEVVPEVCDDVSWCRTAMSSAESAAAHPAPEQVHVRIHLASGYEHRSNLITLPHAHACTPCCLQPPAAAARGALQLLDAMDARDSNTSAPGFPSGVVSLPQGFLEQLASREDQEALRTVFEPIGEANYHMPACCVRQLHGPARHVVRARHYYFLCMGLHCCVPLSARPPSLGCSDSLSPFLSHSMAPCLLNPKP